MREYKIKETSLGFIIYKINDDDGFVSVLYWNGKRRDSRRECAKTYLFREEALSVLVVIRCGEKQ